MAGYGSPFTAALDTPAHINKVFTIYGIVPPTSTRFGINLQNGPGPAPPGDVALHVSIRFPEHTVVLNSVQYGVWQAEESHPRIPFHAGAHFQAIIMCGPGSFKVAFNGVHFAEFFYRLPLESVTHLQIDGNVQVHSVSGVITEGSQQVHNPVKWRQASNSNKMGVIGLQPVPLLRPIEGGVFPGRLLRIRGRANFSGGRFEINLQNGPRSVPQDDTVLHMSVRPAENFIALNSLRGSVWETEQRIDGAIHAGSAFEILILCEADHFKIAVNGSHRGEFGYRFPLEYASYIFIQGEAHLSLVGIEGRPRNSGIVVAPLSQIVGSYSSPYEGSTAHFPTPYTIF